MNEFDQENIEDIIKSIIENDLIKKIENESSQQQQIIVDDNSDNDDVNLLKYRIKQLEHKLNEKINEENNYETEIVKLKQIITEKDKENQNLEHKLNEIETSTRVKLEQINADFQKKFSDAFKQFEECQKDTKTSMIMKYAQAEKRYLDSQRNCDLLNAKVNNLNKEKQRLCDNIDKLKSDKQKQIQEYEQKVNENNTLKKQFDKLREDIVLNNAKINVEHMKFKKEYEAHVRTKLIVENLEKQISELTQKLSVYEPINKPDTINGDNNDNSNGNTDEPLTTNNNCLTVTNEEIEKLKEKISYYESECKNYELIIQKYNETLQNQKQMNKDLLTEVLPLRELQVTLTKEQHEKKLLQAKLEELQNEINDLNQEMFNSKQKQNELLAFTSKLTEKNTKLQSDNQLLNEKVDMLNKELENTKLVLSKSEESVKIIAASLNEKLNEQIKQNELLDTKLKEKTKLADELNTKLNDEQDENQSLKRKHAANIKDLSKQIQKLQKQIDGYNNNGNTNHQQQQQSTKNNNNQQVSQNDHHSNGHSINNQLIRSNSITSLDKEEMRSINGSISSSDSTTQQTQQPQQQQQQNCLLNFNNSYDNNSMSAASTDVYVVDIDKQKIIEKVVKLQKSLAKRNEKIDFLQDHVNQLTLDLQRKTKIIQAYAMKDDVGAFSGDSHEAAKRLLSRNGNNMTMELCMEINGKLQSLLEDTLIKNITLKESIERLGEEIAHLTEENRHFKAK